MIYNHFRFRVAELVDRVELTVAVAAAAQAAALLRLERPFDTVDGAAWEKIALLVVAVVDLDD